MIVAVPIRDGSFCSHFGGAEAFTLFTIDDGRRTVTGRETVSPPEHGRGVFPMWLRRQGANVVLAGGMGPRAEEIFAHHGIDVVLGVEGRDPEALIASYLVGELASTGVSCHDHGFHDCDHHHERGAERRGCH
jgi:predicted Fe-Mo cluster-binding NifX family protein